MENLPQKSTLLEKVITLKQQGKLNDFLNTLTTEEIQALNEQLDNELSVASLANPKMSTPAQEAPVYEKVWRQFAGGSGQLLDTVGELVNKASKLITPDPLMQYQGQKIANKIKEVGKETMDYWEPDAYQNKFHGIGGEIVNTLIRETPSLIAFSPVMRTTGSLAMSAFSPKSTLGKSIVESVGSGAGYTGVNLLGRENYDWKDAGIDTAIDFTFGAASPLVVKAVKTNAKQIDPLFKNIKNDLVSLLKLSAKAKDKFLLKKVKKAYDASKKGDSKKALIELEEAEIKADESNQPLIKQKIKEIKQKITPEENLPEPVKEAGAETTDAYVDLRLQNNDFNKIVKLAVDGKLPTGQLIKIGKPSKILQIAGIPDKEIVLSRKIIKNKISKHELTLDDLKDFHIHINNPLAVYQSPKNENKIVLIPKMKGNNLLISAIEINSKRRGATEVNDIRTIYFKDIDKLNNEIKVSPEVSFVNRKKLSEFLRASAQSNSGQDQKLQELINNLIEKSKKSSDELYAGIPVDKLFNQIENAEKAAGKWIQADNTLPAFSSWRDPEDVFKAIGKPKYYELTDKAYKRQTRLEKGYNKIIQRINENLHDEEDKQLLERLLFTRDKFKIEKIEDIENALGVKIPENVKEAYRAFDEGMKWAARLLDLNINVGDKKWKPFLQLLTKGHLEKVKERALKRGKEELVKKIEKQIEKGNYFKALPKGLVSNIKTPDDLEKRFMEKLGVLDFENPNMQILAYNLKRSSRLYGYIPHVFNNYYVADKNGNILATFRKELEARKFIKNNPDIVKPEVREFQFKLADEEALDDPKKFKEALRERMKRLSFHRYIGFKEKRKGTGGWENFPYLVYDKEGKEIIGRFKSVKVAQKFAKEKGGKLVELKALPEKDILKDTEVYLHKVARYRAMEDIKPKLVSMFLKDYGLNLPKDTPIEELRKSIDRIQNPAKRREAKYVVEFLNDIFGRPRDSEQYINDLIKTHPWMRRTLERLGLAYGDRPTLSVLNKGQNLLSYVYLAFKPAQVVIQLSTIPTNTWISIAKQLEEQGVKHQFAKSSEFVAKAMYDFATNKRLRWLALKLVSDNPTVAEINQYTGKTFKKGWFGEFALAPLTGGDRIARAIAFLSKYEQLKAMGYKGDKLKVAKEFAKEMNFSMKVHDTPSALRNPLIRFYMMYKPFLIKEINFLLKQPLKYRLAGSLMLATFLGSQAFLGYEMLDALGITDWLYKHVAQPLDELISEKTKIPREKLEELWQYGLIGALTGISLYQNMGLGDIFGAALSPVKDAYNVITGKGATSSAPLTYVANIIRTLDDISNQDWEKAKEDFVKLLPSYFRKVKDAVDILMTGYIWRNGRPLIKADRKDAIALLLGATPVKLDKFYKMKNELREVKKDRRIGKDKLMEDLLTAYMNKDMAKVNEIGKTLIKEGYYKSMNDIKTALKSYYANKQIPYEIKLYTKAEARMTLKKKTMGQLKELYDKFYNEYKKETNPYIKKAYERALVNIQSVMRVKE